MTFQTILNIEGILGRRRVNQVNIAMGVRGRRRRGGSCYGSGPQSQREFSYLARLVKCVRESGQEVDDAQKRGVSGRIFARVIRDRHKREKWKPVLELKRRVFEGPLTSV